MNNNKLIPGLILVLLGGAFLLYNYGYIDFHWENFFRLWPIFLVIGGINLVFANNKSHWATILKISVVIVGFGLLLFGNFGNRYNFVPHWMYSYHSDDNDDNNNNSKDDDDDDDDDSNAKTAKYTVDNAFNEPYTANVKVARLNISGGATAYDINQSTDGLFDASFKNNGKRYELSHSTEDSVYVLDFKNKGHDGIEFGEHNNNEVNMRLNLNPVWEVNVDAGAAAINFDLSKFKVKEVKLHGGAASFKVKMGMPLAVTEVDVSTGLAGVDISIPKDAACNIDTDSGLSGNDFQGFNKTGDDTYETPGYAEAKNKMHIHISGGLSGFNVKRY